MTRPQPITAPAADLHVFHRRTLRDSAALHETARFADDVWPLHPVILQRHERGLILDFTGVPQCYRLTVKQLCYVLLSGDLPPGEQQRPHINTLLGIFYRLRSFFGWLEDRPDRAPQHLRELTVADLDAFNRHLHAIHRNENYRRAHRSAVRLLWRLRQVLGDHALTFDPAHIPGWSDTGRQRPGENTTDRVPEQVHGPLLVWAMRIVDDFAPDVLAARDAWLALRGQGGTSPIGRGRNEGLAADVRAYLDAHQADGRPLPGTTTGKVNIRVVSLELRCATKSLDRYKDQIDAAAAVVGVRPQTITGPPITGRLDDQPWTDAITTEPTADNGLMVLTRVVQSACYVVVAFLSGMRDVEKRAELHLMQHSSRRNTGDFRRSDVSVGTARRSI